MQKKLHLSYLNFVTLLLVSLIVVVILLYLTLNDYGLNLVKIFEIIFRPNDTADQILVKDFLLNKLAICLIVGASLGIAGALTQNFFNNPLATPDILGINQGASLLVILYYLLENSILQPLKNSTLALYLTPVLAFCGGILTAALIFLLSNSANQINLSKLLLIGIALNILINSVIAFLLTRADENQILDAQSWLIGNIKSLPWSQVIIVGLTALIIIIFTIILVEPYLKFSYLNQEVKQELGISSFKMTLLILLPAVALTALSVTLTGPIAFLAFLAPQVTKFISKSHNFSLKTSALVGMLLLLIALYLKDNLFSIQIPESLTISLIGGSVLLLVLLKSAKRGSL